MNVIETTLQDVLIIEPKVFGDNRGFFMETYQRERYQECLGDDVEFVQDNHSRSSKGVLRGLHFQKTRPQGKLVRVVTGEVYDVVVDINPQSPTYGQYEGVMLSADNKRQLWVPPGYAHGFLVLSETADFEYKCTDYYDPSDEGGVLWNDPSINIAWPLLDDISLSEKDKSLPLLKDLSFMTSRGSS
ncbi:dTDP-4-dehydrorhamnose 3,5-epimerase [Eionea flava]